jgi:hypothetical protein
MALAKLAQVQKEIDAQPEGLRRANLKSLEYIQFMASRTNTDIKKWNIWEMFGAPDAEKTLLADKREVGKVFFEFLEKASAKKEKKSFLDEMPELLQALQGRIEGQLTEHKNVLKRSIRTHVSRADDYYEYIKRELKAMVKCRIELEALEGGDPLANIRNGLDEVLSEGYWINPIFDGGFLYLNTASNIINTYKKKSAGVDISVDLGQFAVKIDLNSFAMWVIPYKNNLRSVSNHYHPHVSTNGRICWGDGSDQVHRWTSQLDLGSVLKLLYSLLHNYSDHAPYCHLNAFKDNSKKYGRIAEGLKHPDRRKKVKKTPLVDKLSEQAAPAEEIQIGSGVARPVSVDTPF